jgi:hypothetical protein
LVNVNQLTIGGPADRREDREPIAFIRLSMLPLALANGTPGNPCARQSKQPPGWSRAAAVESHLHVKPKDERSSTDAARQEAAVQKLREGLLKAGVAADRVDVYITKIAAPYDSEPKSASPDNELRRVQAHVATEVQKAEESKPRSSAEATRHVLEGLVRAIQGCSFLSQAGNDPIARDVGQIVDLLWTGFRGRDPELCDEFKQMARGLRTRGVTLPVGEGFLHPQALARSLVQALDIAKASNNIKAALTTLLKRTQGMEVQPEPPPVPATRWAVAQLLGSMIRTSDTPNYDERARLVYARMPFGGHGHAVDRSGSFKDERFEEDSARTVTAAFVALKVPGAKQVLKAGQVKRWRAGRRRTAKGNTR